MKNQNKKHNIKNILIWGILGLFIISGMMQGNLFGMRNPVVAYVGNLKIKVSDVRKYMNLIQIPENIDRNLPQVQNYIFQKALDLMIQRSLITQECRRLGLVVTNKQVVEAIKKQPQFLVDGYFSRSKFLSELSKLGLSEMEYKSIQKENLLHKQWIFMLQNSYAIPDKIAQSVASVYSQKRSGRYLIIDRNKISVPKLNNNQLEKFYKDHVELFRVPENRVFKIVVFKEGSNEKIDKMLSAQKFDQAAKKFSALTIHSDAPVADLNAVIPENILDILKKSNLQLGQNTNLYIASNISYAAKLIKVEPSYLPEFSKIKSQVYNEYIKLYRMKNANVAGCWLRLQDVKFGENYLGVSDIILNMIFKNPIGKVVRYDKDDFTYYVIVDSIKQNASSDEEIMRSKGYLQLAMLNDVIAAAMNSLQLRYKIKVLL